MAFSTRGLGEWMQKRVSGGAFVFGLFQLILFFGFWDEGKKIRIFFFFFFLLPLSDS